MNCTYPREGTFVIKEISSNLLGRKGKGEIILNTKLYSQWRYANELVFPTQHFSSFGCKVLKQSQQIRKNVLLI